MATICRKKNVLDSYSISRLQTLTAASLQRLVHTLADEDKKSPLSGRFVVDSPLDKGIDTSKWKSIDSRALGIKKSMISAPIWTVLKILQKQGFASYLVGGCVRDLLLDRVPKDFDVVTTATLKQVKKQFHHSLIVGRRFPICHVHIQGSIVEVSSFETGCDDAKEEIVNSDILLWRDCMRRDFTINGLFFDPFRNKVHDYAGGIKDLRMRKVRTLIPANLSFKEDCARILRGLRIAARLGLAFSKDIEAAIRELSPSIEKLAKSRLMMELNFMLAYGAARPSLYLLHKFRLLEILLPAHASYLAGQEKNQSGQSTNFLMELCSSMDKLLGCDRPTDCCLWVALLAFHLALVNHPQDAFVVWVFSLVLYHGGWKKAVKVARENSVRLMQFVPEVLEPTGVKSDESLREAVRRLVSLVQSSVDALTDTGALAKLMATYQLRSSSGLVFISRKTHDMVLDLFDPLGTRIKSYSDERETFDINYKLLAYGDLRETRFVLGKVIMDVMHGGSLAETGPDKLQSQENNPTGHTSSDVQEHNQEAVQSSEIQEAIRYRESNAAVHLSAKEPIPEVEIGKNQLSSQFLYRNEVQASKQEKPEVKKNNRPLSSLFV